MQTVDEIFNNAVEKVRARYGIKKTTESKINVETTNAEDILGVPSIDELKRQFGITAENERKYLDNDIPIPRAQIESDPFSESMLPTQEEMLATFLEKDQVANKAPIPKPEVESELDEMGIPTIEEMKKSFGIRR